MGPGPLAKYEEEKYMFVACVEVKSMTLLNLV